MPFSLGWTSTKKIKGTRVTPALAWVLGEADLCHRMIKNRPFMNGKREVEGAACEEFFAPCKTKSLEPSVTDAMGTGVQVWRGLQGPASSRAVFR